MAGHGIRWRAQIRSRIPSVLTNPIIGITGVLLFIERNKGGKVGMSMELVNRICPNCKNPNYMVLLGDFSKAYKYKCMNCNGYFNDIDFEKEPLQLVCESKCMNTKVDLVEVVRCKYCKHWDKGHTEECDNLDSVCFHNGWCKPDWFCADGERW